MNAILKKTGTVSSAHRAGDGRYLSESTARADLQFVPITGSDLKGMVGHPWRVFQAAASGKIVRRAPEVVGQRKGRAGASPIHSGIISEAYARLLKADQAAGIKFFVRKFMGVKALAPEQPYLLTFNRGEVRPLTYMAKVAAGEMGWLDDLSLKQKLSICGKVIRSAVRKQPLSRRTIKTSAGLRKASHTVAAHNLVFAPSPHVLSEVRTEKLPIDRLMETAARRALEQYERENGVRLTAICSTHLQASTGFRPHLHIRLVAYDSAGKYVPVFDRLKGNAKGNRCRFEEEMRRQFERGIERERSRGRE